MVSLLKHEHLRNGLTLKIVHEL